MDRILRGAPQAMGTPIAMWTPTQSLGVIFAMTMDMTLMSAPTASVGAMTNRDLTLTADRTVLPAGMVTMVVLPVSRAVWLIQNEVSRTLFSFFSRGLAGVQFWWIPVWFGWRIRIAPTAWDDP